jgi:hypothetical protein
MLFHVSSGSGWLCQVRSCFFRFGQVISRKVRIGQVKSGYYILCQVRWGCFRVDHMMTG